MFSTTALCQFTIFDLWTIKHAVPTAGRGWKRRGGDYPLTKTDLPVTIWSLPLLHSHHNGSPWQIYSQAMLLVKGECMQAEFKARFKNSGGLGAKISLFVLKMLQYPHALSLTWLQNCKTVTVITYFTTNIPNWDPLLSWDQTKLNHFLPVIPKFTI